MKYRLAPELRTATMPSELPVFAADQIPRTSIYISYLGWTVVMNGQVEQMPAGTYVYGVEEQPEKVTP